MAYFNRFLHAETGQSLIEFALAIPVFLMLTVGLIDLGRVTLVYSVITQAARQGARYGAVYGGSQYPSFDWVTSFDGNAAGTYDSATGHVLSGYVGSSTIAGIVERSLQAVDPTQVTLTITPLGSGTNAFSPGTAVQVQVVYPFQPLTTLIVGSTPIDLTARSTMIIE